MRERKIEWVKVREREKVREMKGCTDRSVYVLENYDEDAKACSCHHVSHSSGG